MNFPLFIAPFKRARKFLLSVFAHRIFLVVFLPILMGAVFSFSLLLLNAGAVVRGVVLEETPVGMFSYDDLSFLVHQKAASFDTSPITLVLPNGVSQRLPLQTLGVHVDTEQTTNSVFSVGRANNVLENGVVQVRALMKGARTSYQTAIDEQKLSYFIEHNLSLFNHPAQNAEPIYDTQKNSFAVQVEQPGIIIDKQQFEDDLKNRTANLSHKKIVLLQRDDLPHVSYEDALDAQAQANQTLLKLPLILRYPEGSLEVKQEDAISWMDFIPEAQSHHLVLSLNRQRVQDYLTLLAPGLNKEPIDARFTMENNKVAAFQISQEGRMLDMPQSTSAIIRALDTAGHALAGQTGQTTPPTSVNLAFVNIDPAITSASIQSMGITKLLARGTTDFSNSHKARIMNIGIGSSKYEGLLIAPGEEFSFDKMLGDVGPAQGYLPELVIKKGKTVPEYGGGLCQVSTTMFRTAVLAGLQITERYNHAYVVKYYGTPGFDATIYPPSPDLKFVNNTPGYILIQHQILGTKLQFEFYGADDGRKVEIDGPHVYDKRPNGAMKAILTQKVLDAQGNIMFQKKFYSNYAPASLYPVERNPLE